MSSSNRDLRLRELLLWCAPALAAGVILRVFMMIRMPYGYIQFDTADFLVTPFRLLFDHHYVIDSKKAFLTPTFFSIPFLLHIPALIFIPVTQHLMGLLQVVIAGAIIRLWLPLWRWIIVPATLLVSVNPWQLWYEHALMGEANYVFFLFLVALLGAHWALRPTWRNFTWLALALFCIAGTRAEGKIMLLFGVALIPIVLWPRWTAMLAAGIALLVVYEIASLGAGGSHAFSLLYATLFKLTPNDIQSEPDIAPYVLPLRDEIIRSAAHEPNDLVALAKRINDQVDRYAQEKRGAGKRDREQIADAERSLCVEILKRRPLEVIAMPFEKFHMASDAWPSGADFGRHELLEKQARAVDRLHDEANILSAGLTGRRLNAAGLLAFIPAHYDPDRMAWFTSYEIAWSTASIALRLPDHRAVQPRWAHDFISVVPRPEWVMPGVPLYFLVAFAGMLAAMFIPMPLRIVQTAWLLAMLFTWYCATMVGVTNARFRFAYEPVCYIYDVAAIVWAIGGIIIWTRRFRQPKPESESCTAS